MQRLYPKSPITAILYHEGREIDPVMAAIARALQARSVRLAGFIQSNLPRENHRRCDMALQEIASGKIISISQQRGPLARGCHLNVSELLRGMQLGRQALEQRPDLLLINKFGKTEGEGGGFRPLIARALELGVPVLIAVPWRNIESWRLFSGDLATEITLESLAGGNRPAADILGLGLGQDSKKHPDRPDINRLSLD